MWVEGLAAEVFDSGFQGFRQADTQRARFRKLGLASS